MSLKTVIQCLFVPYFHTQIHEVPFDVYFLFVGKVAECLGFLLQEGPGFDSHAVQGLFVFAVTPINIKNAH